MVIYRGVAADRRPGAPPAESDTFIVEIAAPGAVAMEGFCDRRPHGSLRDQPADGHRQDRAAAGAASDVERGGVQGRARGHRRRAAPGARRVRLHDGRRAGGRGASTRRPSTKKHEAEPARRPGRGAPRESRPRRSHAGDPIDEPRRGAARTTRIPPSAAAEEKAALAFLQRAFSRSRYILRTLSERERLDLSRRLTGVLAALGARSTAGRRSPRPIRAPRRFARLLADVAALDARGGQAAATAAADAAQRVLRIDPRRRPRSGTSRELLSSTSTRLATASGASAAIVRDLDRAAVGDQRADPRRADPAATRFPVARRRGLEGALADALRRSAAMMVALWRIVAMAIAVAGVVDPAITSSRRVKPDVALVAGSARRRRRAGRSRCASARDVVHRHPRSVRSAPRRW